MSQTVRVSLVALLLLILGCAPRPDHLLTDINASLDRAAAFLISKQSPDGAWRSDVYGPMKDGPSLTPHVATATLFLDRSESVHRARNYLATIDPATLRYPIYSAAAMSWLARSPPQRAAWTALVRSHQLDETLGWSPADPEYGGWGYSVDLPRKASNDPLAASNISATVYGLGALRTTGVPMSDPAYAKVLTFAQRCQNDDGGFFFMPNDAARNKAGPAAEGRFHSYGSTTADGVRILLHAGLPKDHARVLAARRWLETHFDPAHNPGRFEPDREAIRDATYYYYAWSVSHAFLHLSVEDRIWARTLAAELIRRQNTDGSWTNPYRDTKEDDPLVATPHAAAALVICREVISGDYAARHIAGGGVGDSSTTLRASRGR